MKIRNVKSFVSCYVFQGFFWEEAKLCDRFLSGDTAKYRREPAFHSGHTSNIRCLAFCEPSGQPSRPKYLLSGGGRGMLAVWRLDSDVPGLLGWVCLDNRGAGPLISCPTDQGVRKGSMCDLRVMTLLGIEVEDHLIIIAGCSDGIIR